jgi:polyadenylate-binding protein
MGVSPSQRKNMIGERLYTQIFKTHANLAGKITGMLLEGMDDFELINLLTTPNELDNRIREAIEVLNQHSKASATATN